MNFIIGTAGHVDHGKTALIKALTGIDTMHLPEEKNRGMTIDLGFAYFNDESGNPVGVIDVPGHERFIRNMAAGIWSLDCVLLVVAADDGWMQMTTDHARVIHAMGIKNIILTVTKTDLSDEETLALVVEEAQEKCMEILGKSVPVVLTSSSQNIGIEKLRSEIINILKNNKKPESESDIKPDSPLVYIDRAFTLQGVGITVTGSLKNGTLSKNDEVLLLPGEITGRIKGIQSHYRNMETAEPSSRVALNIKLSKKSDVKRGMVIVKNRERAFVDKEIMIKLSESYFKDKSSFKNHKGIELAFGTNHEIGTIHLLKKDSEIARVVLKKDAAFYWGQPGVLIPHGGNTVIGSFRIIWAGKTDRTKRIKIADIVTQQNPESYIRLLLFLEGVRSLKDTPGLLDDKNVIITGSRIFDKKYMEEIKAGIINIVSNNTGGLTEGEIASKINLPFEAVKELLQYLINSNEIVFNNRVYQKSLNTDTYNLSVTAKAVLSAAEKAGSEGIIVSKLGITGAQKEARVLVRTGYLVHLEEGLYYTNNVYQKIKSEVLKDLKPGDNFSIADVRIKTRLSRKYIIPLLNLMESELLIKRNSDKRVVL